MFYDRTNRELRGGHVFRLAAQVATLDLGAGYRDFEWQGKRLPAAWQERESLESLGANSRRDVKSYAQEVYSWGFNRKPIATAILQNAEFVSCLTRLIECWSNLDQSDEAEEARCSSLAHLLALPHVGIATVSKWICFLDQSSYAIYDSRVSLALREVLVDHKRAFPIVGRRSTKNKRAWHNDAVVSKPHVMARLYQLYLAAIREVSSKSITLPPVGVTKPAQVEMALFMLGNVWPDTAERKPFSVIV